MARKYLAFDVETAANVPGPEFNWRDHRPLGITCAAALASDLAEPMIWLGKSPDGNPAKQMSRAEAHGMVDQLREMVLADYTLLTWNGLGFDFDVLAEEADALKTCRELALNHVDMMFHIFCDRGFPVALDKAAHALGIPGKPPGMSGLLAPQMWEQGQFKEVMDYVVQDVRIALNVAHLCEERGSFTWTTRRGSTGSMPLGNGWLTVREALKLPEPDTSWMSSPLPRSDFTHWLGR